MAKTHIVAHLAPLMTFLAKIINGNPNQKKCLDHIGKKKISFFAQILTYYVILSPKWRYFENLPLKLTILTNLTPLLTFLVKIIKSNPPWNNISKFFGKIFFDHPLPILTYDVILAQKWPKMALFHPKWPILTVLTPWMT